MFLLRGGACPTAGRLLYLLLEVQFVRSGIHERNGIALVFWLFFRNRTIDVETRIGLSFILQARLCVRLSLYASLKAGIIFCAIYTQT